MIDRTTNALPLCILNFMSPNAQYFSEDSRQAVRDAYAKDYELFSGVLELHQS